MTSSFNEITAAIEFCSRAISTNHTLLLCLEFYIDILTHVVIERDETCHKELVDLLFSILLSSHFIYQSQISSPMEQRCYDNHFAALLSFYIELCLLTRLVLYHYSNCCYGDTIEIIWRVPIYLMLYMHFQVIPL